jgi:hypothetical protein
VLIVTKSPLKRPKKYLKEKTKMKKEINMTIRFSKEEMERIEKLAKKTKYAKIKNNKKYDISRIRSCFLF